MSPEERTFHNACTCSTSFGWVAFSWSAGGLNCVTLPQETEAVALCQLPESILPTPALPAGLDPSALAAKFRRYFEGSTVDFDEPLEPAIGTSFQRRVWAITRSIPRGETKTYGQIAREAGSPSAARAVGQTMARNPWPIIVPCHRVIGHDGQLTGFGGGLIMKQRMLEMEGATGHAMGFHPGPLE